MLRPGTWKHHGTRPETIPKHDTWQELKRHTRRLYLSWAKRGPPYTSLDCSDPRHVKDIARLPFHFSTWTSLSLSLRLSFCVSFCFEFLFPFLIACFLALSSSARFVTSSDFWLRWWLDSARLLTDTVELHRSQKALLLVKTLTLSTISFHLFFSFLQ